MIRLKCVYFHMLGVYEDMSFCSDDCVLSHSVTVSPSIRAVVMTRAALLCRY